MSKQFKVLWRGREYDCSADAGVIQFPDPRKFVMRGKADTPGLSEIDWSKVKSMDDLPCRSSD